MTPTCETPFSSVHKRLFPSVTTMRRNASPVFMSGSVSRAQSLFHLLRFSDKVENGCIYHNRPPPRNPGIPQITLFTISENAVSVFCGGSFSDGSSTRANKFLSHKTLELVLRCRGSPRMGYDPFCLRFTLTSATNRPWRRPSHTSPLRQRLSVQRSSRTRKTNGLSPATECSRSSATASACRQNV